MKRNKGITMISLVITIIVLLIVTSITIYNGIGQLGIKRVNNLYADIDSISTKVAEYYLKNESLPVFENNKYVDSKEELEALFKTNGSTEDITNVNDGEEYYVLNLSKLDNLTLNYGEDYKDWTSTSIAHDIQNLYIINSITHQIYFPHGVRSGNDYYFARFPDKNEISPIELEEIEANWTIDITNISGNNIDEDNISIVADVTLSGLTGNYDLNSLQYAWSDVDVESELANIEFTKFNVSNTSEGNLAVTLSSKGLSNTAEYYYLYIKAMDKNGEYSYQKLTNSASPLTGNLPRNYQRVEYIESTGSQYIDTGIVPSQTLSFICEFQNSNTSGSGPGYGNVFGSRVSSTNSEYQLSLYDQGMISVGQRTSKMGFNTTDRHKISFDGENIVIIDGMQKTITTSSFSGIYNIYLFGINQSGRANQLQQGKIYSCSFGKVRNFIPCIKNPNTESTKTGLYDLVEGNFYENQGTGDDFIAGPNVE